MDLSNYAVLVFDLAPDMAILEGIDMTSFELSFSSMDLETVKLIENTD